MLTVQHVTLAAGHRVSDDQVRALALVGVERMAHVTVVDRTHKVTHSGADTGSSSDHTVRIVGRFSKKPLRKRAVEINSEVPFPCIKPPCISVDKQPWTGATDDAGLLQVPGTLDKPLSVLYVRAAGSEFWADQHGPSHRDNTGYVIVELEPAQSQ